MLKRNKPHTLDSLMERTRVEADCLIWTGSMRPNGYGTVVFQNRQRSVHAVVYHLLNPEFCFQVGTEIDHTCNNRACINPNHLQEVTHTENMRLAVARRKTCRAGHEWNEQNTYTARVKRKQGGYREQRFCRVCRRIAAMNFRNKGGFYR